MTSPFRILVLCTGNSARSQIAEALLAMRGAGRIVAGSAGSHPAAEVNPLAVATLTRHGIPWQGRVPKGIEEVSESCPHFVGASARVHWGLPDPADSADFEAVFEALDRLVTALLRSL